jgi:aminomethyltransferase
MDIVDSKKILKNGFFRGTPFHNSSAGDVASGFWYGWGEYVIPDVYSSMYEELHAIRNTAGIIDMSPLPKMYISGQDSTKLLDRLMTRSISELAIERCLYAPWCNKDGLLIGDGIIFRLSEENYMVAGENSVSWFQSNINNLSVEVVDKTHDYGILSVQGPRSDKSFQQQLAINGMELIFRV